MLAIVFLCTCLSNLWLVGRYPSGFHKDGFMRIKYQPYLGSTLLSYADEGCFYEMEDFYLRRLFFHKWGTRRVTPPEFGLVL
jgi:hypothetical protein